MMNNTIFRIAFPVFVLGALIALLQVSSVFKVTTVANNDLQPNYHKNSLVFVSCLKSFTYNDIVLFRTAVVPAKNSPPGLLRISGLPGDTIEIHDGYLLRNSFFADHPEKLMFRFDMRRDLLTDTFFFKYLRILPETEKDQIHFYVSQKEYKYISHRYLLQKFQNLHNTHTLNSKITKSGLSNFGPMVIPEGYCFVLGDNRDMACDSRLSGLVSCKNIIATVLFPR